MTRLPSYIHPPTFPDFLRGPLKAHATMAHSQNYYHSSNQPSRTRDGSNIRREERLPSLRHVVGDVYESGTPSAYNFHDVRHSLPNVSNDTTYSRHPGGNDHDYSPSGLTLPPIHLGNPPRHHAHSSHSTSSHSSTPRHPPHNASSHARTAPVSSSSRTHSNAEYSSDRGHTYEAFYSSRDGLVSLSTSSRPHGVIRTSEVPDDHDDPKKRYKCLECGKGFDRPSGLEQHQTRHTGDRPYPCTVQGCDKSFTARSNMTRHVRTQHSGQSDDADHSDDRGSSRYFTHSRGSSDKSSSPSAYYSSSRRS